MGAIPVALPAVAALVAAVAAQSIKVITFALLEKRLNFRRFVETAGTPNMHSAAFFALTLSVGLSDGFDSIVFALALCVTAMTSVDTWNVKGAASRHAELIVLLVERVSKTEQASQRGRKVLSYTPVDVLSGAILGVIVALLIG